ncbi:hypothetical protein ACQY0O_007791 [Thecaphora frezii]
MVKLALSFVALAMAATSASAATTCQPADYTALTKLNIASCDKLILKDLSIPEKTSLNLTKLKDGAEVIFQGTTTFAMSQAWDGVQIQIAGNNLYVHGEGATINANGQQIWDGKGSNGGKSKPKHFNVHKVTNSRIGPLTIKNTPKQAFSINNAKNVQLDHITITNNDPDGLAHNTDAFDVSESDGVFITNPTINNQDDCLAINSGTNILFSGATCTGGHGISIGSVGGRDNNVVDGVWVENSKISKSTNGVRVKALSTGTGLVNNVTYTGITLDQISENGIIIQQDYTNAHAKTGTVGTGIPFTNFNIKGVTGTLTSSATRAYIMCGNCKDWKWSGNTYTGGKTYSGCQGLPNGISC